MLYAKLRIPEYWLIDLRNAEVMNYSAPKDGVYEMSQTLIRGQMLESSAVADLSLAVDILLQLAVK